jgi:hypothetical protein
MNIRPRAALPLVLALSPLVLAGCGSEQRVGVAPGDRYNPALTPHQRDVLAARKSQQKQDDAPSR